MKKIWSEFGGAILGYGDDPVRFLGFRVLNVGAECWDSSVCRRFGVNFGGAILGFW